MADTPQTLTEIASAAMQGTLSDDYSPLPMQEDSITNPEILGEYLEDEPAVGEVEKPVDSEEERPAEAPQKPATDAGLIVKDESGKSYKLKVDLANPKQVQVLAQKAFQADKLAQEVTALRETAAKAQDFESEFAEIQGLMSEKGLGGVVDYLLDQEGGFEEYIEKERQRRNLLDSSDPSERDAALREYELEKRERQIKAKEAGLASKESKTQEEAKQAASDRTQSMFNNAWGKNSFAGKLGDAEVEDMFDQGVFNVVSAEIQQLQDAGKRLSQADVNKIVETAFTKAKRGLGSAVDKQTKQETQASKMTASKAIEARVAAPTRPASAQSDALQAYKKGSGSVSDIVKAFLAGRK
jgi:hypothetical protein